MKRIGQIIRLSLLIPFLCSCFKKKEEPFKVTYKVDRYSVCAYAVAITYIDSTGKSASACTTKPHWSKTVCLPKHSCASLVVSPFYSKEMRRRDFERGLFDVDTKIYLSAKIQSGDKVVRGESGEIVSLVLLSEVD